MSRNSWFILFLICLLIIPVSCYAEDCDMVRLKQMAENVDIISELDEEAYKMGIYNKVVVTVHGLSDEIFVMTKDHRYIFDYDNRDEDGNVKQSLEEGEYRLQVFSSYCSSEPLKVISKEFKARNVYSDIDKCEGLENEVGVCSPDYDGDKLTYDDVIEEINKYNESKQFNKKGILDIIKDNIILISISIVIIIGIIVALVIKNIRENRLE